jgi:ABC-2 type transport system permease protein
MLSAVSAIFVQDAPDVWYMRLASLVPLTAPFVMPVRAALGHPAAWEVAVAVAIMLGATYALMRVAAGVYAGGLLRTGGRPRMRDVLRAARAD